MKSDDLVYSTVISIFKKQKEQKIPLTINGTGEQRRDFTYVKDVAKMNLIAMNSSKICRGEIINVGSGINYSVKEIADTFNSEIIYKPVVLEPKITLCCMDKACSLGWNPEMNLVEWLQSNKS